MQKIVSPLRQTGWLVPALEPLTAWAAAGSLFLLVLALRLEISPDHRSTPFLAFFPLVLVAAWVCGRAPAAAVAIASTAAAWWFLIRGPGVLAWPGPTEIVAPAVFLASSLLAVALITGLARVATRATTAQARAEAAAARQQALMAELQHRVANNLQAVSATLTLQARRIESTEQAAALRDAVRRLDAVGRLHRLLVSAGADADAAGILEDLSRAQFEAGGDGRVTLDLDLQPGLRLDPDRVILVGMIVSEAISNALKHGFPGARTGRLAVRLRGPTPTRAELEVRDTGVGLPEGFELARADSLGLRIVQSLVARLDGTLSLATDRGAALRVTFPIAVPAAAGQA